MTKNKIAIMKNGKLSYCTPRELAKYLENGWEKKGIKTLPSNSVWVNNGQEGKRISSKDLDEFLSNGWTRGRIKKNKGILKDD